MRATYWLCGALTFLLVGATDAAAQYRNDRRLICESNMKQRNVCQVDTSGGVRLLRQISGSPCRYGSSWGFTAEGIWVDRGCRAEFEVGPPPRNNARWRDNPDTIICESNDMRRRYCRAPIRRDVRLLNQLSQARCVEGETWGHDDRGIWVDRGCRAEFDLRPGRRNGDDGYWGAPREQRVSCGSDEMKFHRCLINGPAKKVQLEKQRSRAACTEGTTWGWDKNSVWVNQGCRGDFYVFLR
jgi:hypothetical protein